MVVFKMRDSEPSPRYSAICNVLRQWKTSLIPTLESTDSMICSSTRVHVCRTDVQRVAVYAML